MARKYRRLTASEDTELVMLWTSGGMTMADLAVRYRMSVRGVQTALARLGAPKKRGGGAIRPTTAVAHTAAPPLPVYPTVKAGGAATTQAVLNHAFAAACTLETMTMASVHDAVAQGGIGALRALDLAASALTRIVTLKRQAIGLGSTNPVTAVTELPELTIREMTADEVIAMRRGQEQEDAEQNGFPTDDGDADDDDIEEGAELGEVAVP